jgi:hypothetical protein
MRNWPLLSPTFDVIYASWFWYVCARVFFVPFLLNMARFEGDFGIDSCNPLLPQPSYPLILNGIENDDILTVLFSHVGVEGEQSAVAKGSITARFYVMKICDVIMHVLNERHRRMYGRIVQQNTRYSAEVHSFSRSWISNSRMSKAVFICFTSSVVLPSYWNKWTLLESWHATLNC